MHTNNYVFCKLIITGRNEVVAKVMFLLVSVILSTGGVSRRETPWQGPPGKETPLAGRPPSKETPLPGGPPGQGDPPARRTPLARRTPPPRQGDPPSGRETPPPGIRSMSGRYASYWNAFLFRLIRYLQVELMFHQSLIKLHIEQFTQLCAVYWSHQKMFPGRFVRVLQVVTSIWH